jgi:hypothetical protein
MKRRELGLARFLEGPSGERRTVIVVATTQPTPRRSGTTSTAPRTGTVRTRILGEHRKLRERLDLLELAIDELRDAPDGRASVNRAARDLLRKLIAHTRLEDAILAPTLRAADAWGTVRERSLLEHHAEQRDTLTSLIESYTHSDEDIEETALRTLSWISDVRADMDHEERTMLNDELLDRWNLAIDGEAG